ncbi:MAG TPA: hypothetical protein EYG68_05100 [Leucothrix mucor]|nr:hypothetical protein [Leucothrix mucor]
MTKTLLSFQILLGCCLFLNTSPAYTKQKSTSFSHQQHDSLQTIIEASLYDEGLETFNKITQLVENNIQWSSGKTTNRYLKAHRRCIPYLKKQTRKDMPPFVFLIAYLESGWRAKVGNPDHDYGYWQMIPEIVKEIRQLPESSEKLKKSSLKRIRSNKNLSTEAALIHLHRYYFYFRHVANFEEADAWMFTLVAFNWGAGNVKRMLIAMDTKEENLSFSLFYQYLAAQSKVNKEDKSMRVAVEYIPNLWNIALLLVKK